MGRRNDRPAGGGRNPFARKRFGQHFLEPAWVDKVIEVIAPAPGDVFLEIGPGRGALTKPLAVAAGRVIAFEIDRTLAQALRQTAMPGLVVVDGNFLSVTPSDLDRAMAGVLPAPATPIRVAGNLPYNVAAPILFTLIDLYRGGIALADATVMLQREVADRLLAPPGTRDYGVLSVLVRHAADAERRLELPPGAFRPAPKVQSTVVRLRFREDRPPAADRKAFAELVQSVFTRRRKTLANALRAYRQSGRQEIDAALSDANLDGTRRPETLDIPEFVRLSNALL